MKFIAVPDTNNLIAKIELTKIKVTVGINRKWPNLDYPSCHLVGRHNVSCDHQTLYSLGGVRAPDFEIWPVIIFRKRIIQNTQKQIVWEHGEFLMLQKLVSDTTRLEWLRI